MRGERFLDESFIDNFVNCPLHNVAVQLLIIYEKDSWLNSANNSPAFKQSR
jgi:hypothetical protein